MLNMKEKKKNEKWFHSKRILKLLADEKRKRGKEYKFGVIHASEVR